MEDGMEKLQNAAESSAGSVEGNVSELSTSGNGTPTARCPAHPVGSMLNPLAFDELAAGGEDVWIACSGQVYRLRRTKLEKLILTK